MVRPCYDPAPASCRYALRLTPRRAAQSLDIFLHGDGPLQAAAASDAAAEGAAGARESAGAQPLPAAAAAPPQRARQALSRWTTVDEGDDAKGEREAAAAVHVPLAPVTVLGGDWPSRAAGAGGCEQASLPPAAATPASAAATTLSEAERARLRSVELAVEDLRDRLEEAGGLSRGEIEARVAAERQRLLAQQAGEESASRGRDAERRQHGGGAEKRKRSRSRER